MSAGSQPRQLKVLQPLGLQSMRPGNTALLVIAATRVDEHVEAVDVQQVAAHLDAKNRGLRSPTRVHRSSTSLERRQVFAGHTRNGELHGHAAFALANALDLKLAQELLHDLSRNCIPRAYHHRARELPRHGDQKMADVAQEFDYIVVGGGTAGCALAARLSEDAARTVCLLEAGGSVKSWFINVPGAIVMAQRSTPLNWRFQTVPQLSLTVAAYRCLADAAWAGLRSSMAWFISGATRGTMTRGLPPGPPAGATGRSCRTFEKANTTKILAPAHTTAAVAR